MKIENPVINNIKFTRPIHEKVSQNIQDHFDALNVIFLNLDTSLNFDKPEAHLLEGLINDLNAELDFFSSLTIYETASSLSFKDKVVTARTHDTLSQCINFLKYSQKTETSIAGAIRKAKLELQLIKSLFYLPTVSQADMINLGHYSSKLAQAFSTKDLLVSFELPKLEDALKDPSAFGRIANALSILTESVHSLLPYIPPDSQQKIQMSRISQNLFDVTFNAKMLLNQLNFGQKDQVEASVQKTFDSLERFLNQIEIPSK